MIDAGGAGTSRRQQIKRGGFHSRVEAAEAMTAELARIDAGTWTDDQGITVGQWLDQWLDRHAGEIRTIGSYSTHIEQLWRPRLGDLRMRDLRRHHVEDALRHLRQEIPADTPGRKGRPTKLAPSTIDGYRRTLRAALTPAVAEGIIATNWAQGRMQAIPSRRSASRDLVIWEPEQTARFLEAVVAHPLAALFELAAYAGLRRGELCGVRWSDIDEDGVSIRQTLGEASRAKIPQELRPCPYCSAPLLRDAAELEAELPRLDDRRSAEAKIKALHRRAEHRGLFFKRSKSEAGDRWVPLVAQAQAALTVHRLAQDEMRQQIGPDYADHGLVFCLPGGGPLRPGDVTKAFKVEVTNLTLPEIVLHDMRHGACSLLLSGGVPIEVVQMIMGHSSPAVTRRIYSHILRGQTSRQVEQAARLLDEHRPGRRATGDH